MSADRPPTRARGALLGALLGALALLTGCVGMPTEGPVVESQVDPGSFAAPGSSYDPLPPRAGQTPSEIVDGFLEAMKATPISLGVARQFLTVDAQGQWDPKTRIMTYAELDPPTGQTTVSTRLSDVNHYDERGAWVRADEAGRLDFTLAVEGGEWRIAKAPDALVVPGSWFANWYQRVSLYFFDPTARILVPEPVFVPEGDQFASSLVRGLLTPPAGRDDGVVRTFFPSGTDLGLSVPINSAGIAEVSLEGDPDAVDDETGQRMLTQLVWTLQQDLRINAVELTVGGRRIDTSTGATQVRLAFGAAFDPTGASSTSELFALQDGLLIRGPLGSLGPTAGPLGQVDVGARAFGVSLSGETVAAVAGGGSTLLVAPVEQADGRVEEVIRGAADLAPPAWDHRDRAWVLDRAAGSARVHLMTNTVPRELVVRGITGRDVSQLLVSRDGSRLLAVRRGPEGDEVVAARVQHDDDGRILRVRHARPLALPDGGGRIRDIAWRTPTAVSVLSVTGDLSEVRTVSVDGAPGEIATEGSTRQRGRTSSLVSSPVEAAGTYLVSGDTVTDLRTPELTLPDLPDGLQGLTYPG
jgi:Lipoprotein LpqB beta-propeller domain/Sporulation and spore germination